MTSIMTSLILNQYEHMTRIRDSVPLMDPECEFERACLRACASPPDKVPSEFLVFDEDEAKEHFDRTKYKRVEKLTYPFNSRAYTVIIHRCEGVATFRFWIDLITDNYAYIRDCRTNLVEYVVPWERFVTYNIYAETR